MWASNAAANATNIDRASTATTTDYTQYRTAPERRFCCGAAFVANIGHSARGRQPSRQEERQTDAKVVIEIRRRPRQHVTQASTATTIDYTQSRSRPHRHSHFMCVAGGPARTKARIEMDGRCIIYIARPNTRRERMLNMRRAIGYARKEYAQHASRHSSIDERRQSDQQTTLITGAGRIATCTSCAAAGGRPTRSNAIP